MPPPKKKTDNLLLNLKLELEEARDYSKLCSINKLYLRCSKNKETITGYSVNESRGILRMPTFLCMKNK